MTGLLTAAAVIATFALLVSAINTAATATARDPQPRGTWGIARWTSARQQSLNPQERRWQTALIASNDSDARWRDLVAELQRLERLSSLPISHDAPAKPDNAWVESRIARLETHLTPTSPTTPGATTK